MNGKRHAFIAIILFPLLAALAGAPGRASAQGDPGTTAAPILRFPVGARAVGMGTAFTAVAADASALYYNPAGLSTIDYREVSFMYLKALESQSVEHISGVTPLGIPGLFDAGYGALAASVLFSQNGSIEYNRLAADGSFLDSRTLSAGSDLVASAAYSERVLHHQLEFKDEKMTLDHFVGIGAKLVRSTLVETYTATAFAGDFGYLLQIPEAGFGFGAAVANVGTEMKFIEEGDPLPMTVRSGVSYAPKFMEEITLPPNQSLLFAADAELSVVEKLWHLNLGAEYSVMRRYALRLGYRANRDLLGLTFGFGAVWRQIGVDYAWGMTSALSDTHRFSFTYRFGRMSHRKREHKRRPFIESMPEREELEDIEERRPEMITPSRRPKRSPERGRTAPGWIY